MTFANKFPLNLTKASSIFFGLSLSVVLGVSSAIADTVPETIPDTRFYPVGELDPLQVGGEEFVDNYASLAGLEGVHVVYKYVIGSAEKYGLTGVKEDLPEQIRTRLESAGLRMLTEEELETTPGQPSLSFFPAYAGNEMDLMDAKAKAEAGGPPVPANLIDENHDCCRSSIWASFQQSARILRDPDTQYMLSTWGRGDDTDSCENRGEWTYDAVLKAMDIFVEDYKKAQAEREPKLVASAADVPESCGQAWLMNLSVFKTNETAISDAVKPILDTLATTAQRCEGYSYMIETHADQRADAEYNKILSEARAHAIKDYLLQKDVSYSRLKTMAFGESKPIAQGTSEEDHAVNRRVVIIPLRSSS